MRRDSLSTMGCQRFGCLIVVTLDAVLAVRPARAQPAAASVPSSSDRSTPAPPSVQIYSPPQPSPPQPSSPPSPNLPQAYPQPYPPQPICPACPAGTFCQNGYCLAPYYSPCPVGTIFDGLGNCIPAGYVQYPAAASLPDPEEKGRSALRMKNRMRPKLHIDLEVAIGMMGDGADPVVAPSVIAWLGYRQNYAPWFGLHLRAGLLLGVATYSTSGGSCDSYYSSDCSSGPTESTRLLGGLVEIAPFFGPFGRFFVGPLLWGGYLDFGASELNSGGVTILLDSGTTLGFGGQFGFVLGDREQTVLAFSLRATGLNTFTMFMSAAIGFDL